MPNPDKPTPETDLAAVTAQARRLGLTGEDRAEYIHKHMTGYGYKARRTYVVPKSSSENRRGGGFFGAGGSDSDDDEDNDD